MRRGRTVGLVAALAVAVGFVAACGQPDESVAPERTLATDDPKTKRAVDVAPQFVGTEWSLTSLRGENLLGSTSITLEIDRDAGRIEVGGTATCNFYGLGKPTMKGGVLKSRGVDSTQIGCHGDKGRQEIAYIDALVNAATYRVRGDTLEVQDATGRTTLVYSRERLTVSDPADLVGTRWLLRSVDGRPLPEDFPTSVSFDSGKRLSGYDGCRHFTGRYFASENDLAVPDFGYQADYDCLKPGAYGRGKPSPVLENIPLDGNYSLGDGRLEIRGDSGVVSVYEPLSEGADVEEPGAAWVLEKFVEHGQVTPALSGTEITLRFDRGTLRKTGTMSGSAGCNAYSADYEYVNEFTSGTPVVTSVTEKACYTPDGVMEQEERYLRHLEEHTYWYAVTIEGELELSTKDRNRRMIFVAPE